MRRAIASLCLLGALVADRCNAQPAPMTVKVSDRTDHPLLNASEPWEDFCITFCRVLRDGDAWRMWYISYDHTYKNDADYFVCYATSTDGVAWERPKLGLVDYNGSKANNIIAKGEFGNGVFIDPQVPPSERYKVVYTKLHGEEWWIHGGVSADGVHWKPLGEPLLKKNSDTDNVCIADNGVYRLYVRMWTEGLYKGRRAVGYTQSTRFGGFADPMIILQPGAKDPPDAHDYNSAATKLRENLYVMLPSVFTTSDGMVRPFLMMSNDGRDFFSHGEGPIIGLGRTFDSTAIYVAPGIPADAPGEYWFYYSGSNAKHDENDPKSVHLGGGIGRFKLKVGAAE
ncbi:MAG TPA: hypothetical protein VL282_00240 [Tepidisphaeraceae bacterium]|jgi:hypothetical protein|nr:hypothetical protein [Tepidisphaeraceae bacterium]